jgi:hypothetical protein
VRDSESSISHTLRRLRLHLHAVPLLELISEDRVDESVLLDDGQALELLRNDVERVHRAAASADVLDLEDIASEIGPSTQQVSCFLSLPNANAFMHLVRLPLILQGSSPPSAC